MNTKHYSELITTIYNAATDASIWGEALDKGVWFSDARSAILITQSHSASATVDMSKMSKVFRDRPDVVTCYQQNYMHHELVAWKAISALPVQSFATDEHVYSMAVDELIDREEYVYLRKNAGCFRKMAARLNDLNTWTDNIAFQFDKSRSNIPSSSISNGNLLLPHIAKAIELGRTFSTLQNKYNAVLSALNHVAVGVCLVDHRAQVLVKNLEAQRILECSDGVVVNSVGALSFKDTMQSAELETAIKLCSDSANGIGSVVNSSFAIARHAEDSPIIVEVAPVRDALNELDSSFHGSVVFLIDPETIPEPSLTSLGLAYGLTDAELQVAVQLVRGDTYQQISECRNVSVQTVKSQVTKVLQKTRSSNKAALIRLAFRCAPPVT